MLYIIEKHAILKKTLLPTLLSRDLREVLRPLLHLLGGGKRRAPVLLRFTKPCNEHYLPAFTVHF